MQKTLMQAKGVEALPLEEKPKGVNPKLVDEYAALTERLSELNREHDMAMLPFEDEQKELDERKRKALEPLDGEYRAVTRKLAQVEREILKGTAGMEQCIINGTMGKAAQVKRTFSRKVDADGLWNALDREGKLDHYGYLFKKSVTVKDFEAAQKQPLFVEGAEAYVEIKVRTESVEVI